MAQEALLEINVSPAGLKSVRIISDSLEGQAVGAELYLCLLDIIGQIDKAVGSRFKTFEKPQ